MHHHQTRAPTRRFAARLAMLAGLAFASLSLGGCIVVAPYHHGYYRY